MDEAALPEAETERRPDGHLGRDLALYTALRVVLVAAVAWVLVLFDIPLLVAVAVGLVAGFPLGVLLFRGLNSRITAGLAARHATRNAERDRLRAQLRGEL
ncbi:DUF4229 domain-containing protein [Actinokineospora inagensis]|uniref:DUF4229 domain-containing protein n=1 Tax=Actinokineospora inagensis TaxID=103730 RepID=UPI000427501F|nr:DUF4229 domain-containing protein [Actinokineospora inagensis]